MFAYQRLAGEPARRLVWEWSRALLANATYLESRSYLGSSGTRFDTSNYPTWQEQVTDASRV